MNRCKECGYHNRGRKHAQGYHHQYGINGHTSVFNEKTGQKETKKRR